MRHVAVRAALTAALLCIPATAQAGVLKGTVESAGTPLASTGVALYRAGASRSQAPKRLATTRSGRHGAFALRFRRQPASAVLYVVAGRGLAAMPDGAGSIVVNERTTVATGFALAQFVTARGISGPPPGPANAVAMGSNLVDARGGVGKVLASAPNGPETSTLRGFNTLANMLVACARSARRCGSLYRLVKPRGGAAPKTLLAAAADIARDPSHDARALFALGRIGPYRPALSSNPGSWTLALRFYGDGKSLNGPGNMAIDAHGYVWTSNNYEWSLDPAAPVCGSNMLFEFTPSGRYAPGSPFSGAGLNGAGFGITVDPDGHVWVGNFGFTSVDCPPISQPPHDSVSEFGPNGTQISPDQTVDDDGGWQNGPISWPQGTISDAHGNIWIANCGNDTVTRYAGGNPDKFLSIGSLGIKKPFGVTVGAGGRVYVTGNGNSTVALLDQGGAQLGSAISGAGLDKPLGIAADSHGNVWIADSQLADVPCPDQAEQPPGGGALTLLDRNGAPISKTGFSGGGLMNPWGVAVDGDDNVWVANFGGQRLSKFCGVGSKGCRAGQALSPSGGYAFDGLVRNTGLQVDPSGNVWVANNWKDYPFPQKNPGGYQVVAFIGLAGPIRTPLLGPPRAL